MVRRAFIGLWLFLAISCPTLAQEETEYYALLMEGKKVGHAIHTRAVQDGRVTTVDDVSVTISRLGVPVTVAMTETNIETAEGKPLGFRSLQQLGGMVMKSEGTVDPNGAVNVMNSSLGVEEKTRMQWPKGSLMAEGLRLLTLKGGLRPGATYQASIFSPSLMQVISTKVVVGEKREVDLFGRVVKLTEMTTVVNLPDTGPITTISYVDNDLRALKNHLPIAGMIVEMIACTKEFAMGSNDVLDLIDKMFVKSPEPIEDVRSTTSITYVLNPAPGAKFTIPSTDNQKVEPQADGRIILTAEPVAPTGGVFPYKGDDPALLEAVKPTRFLQSDRKEIVALARRAVGGTQDSTEAAKRIEAFVAEYIENRSLSVGYASAAEVAESRQGDCSEFAVLTAALCRAVGIPAQVCVGVAYVDEFGGMQGFGGHAWAQAYVGADRQGRGGQWLGLDASFKGSGRGGYDAGHIALAVGNGDPAGFFNMATILGQFKIEKLEVRRAR
ncbi:MAG: transglutaminase domain-containing protein [Sedimentisphaerales bacterium]|nr:transglutaminase domain-containing protein [Sedimentisphaerales bacterium]